MVELPVPDFFDPADAHISIDARGETARQFYSVPLHD